MSAQQKHALSIEDLWSMERIGSYSVSPDGKTIAFDVTKYDMESNGSSKYVYLVDADGSNMRLFKNKEAKLSSPVFTPDGKLSYLKGGNLFVSSLDVNDEETIIEMYTGVSGVEWSTDGNKALFISSVYPDCMSQECNKEKDEAKEKSKVKAEIFDELMFRHWNEWRGDKRSHLFLYEINSKSITDLTVSSPFDVPPIALGGSDDYSFSPDGNSVVYTQNRDKFLATSTDNNVFRIDLTKLKKGTKPEFEQISPGEGNDNTPKYSPDGKYLAFVSMERAGFEADRQRLMLYDTQSGNIRNLSGDMDYSVGEYIWSKDGNSIYFVAANTIYSSIFKIDVATGKYEVLVEKRDNGSISLSPDGSKIYFLQQRSTQPKEIFEYDIVSKKLTQLTSVNKEILANIEWNEVENFWTEGAGGTKVQSIIVKPPFFEEGKKYPVMFLIHGGPQGHWTDDFHYRWNTQMFAAQGYVVVAPNPRGSTGYGQKFTDEISLDWGGKVYTDLMNSLDHALANYSYADKDNIFAAGASYGGYMINWIEGHTDRFNALVCHAGVFNLESMYGVTEELWFPEWEYGGTPWEKPEIYAKWSPNKFVENFKTPMLVIHGANDFRVPEGQAFELFTSLQKMGVESKLLYFPDEYHFVVKPQNARLWWNTVYKWLEDHKK